jgi:hypothetical protein
MISRCANPECNAEFKNILEGELFVIQLPNHVPSYYWLCPRCASIRRVVHEPTLGVQVVARTEPHPHEPWGLTQSVVNY